MVAAREHEFAAMGALASSYWQQCFANSTYFDYIVDRCLFIRDQQKLPEAFYWSMRHPYVLCKRIAAKTRSLVKR